MDEIQRQVELAKLILEQDKDDKSRHVWHENIKRIRPKSLQTIQTISPKYLDTIPVETQQNRLDSEVLKQSGENIKDYNQECDDKWDIAVNKAKQAEQRLKKVSESTRIDEL